MCLCVCATFTSLHRLDLDGRQIICMVGDDRRVDDHGQSCTEGIHKSRLVRTPRRIIIIQDQYDDFPPDH